MRAYGNVAALMFSLQTVVRGESDKLIQAEIWKSDENQICYPSQRPFYLFCNILIFSVFINQNQHSMTAYVFPVLVPVR